MNQLVNGVAEVANPVGSSKKIEVRNRKSDVWALAAALLFLGGLAYSPSAHAFKKGSVRAGGVVFKESPSDSAPEIETLPAGTQLYTSDRPTQGDWYKAKSPSGKIGYVHGASIQFAGAGAPPAGAGKPTRGAPRSAESRSPSPSGPRKEIIVRGMAGLTFFAMSDFYDRLGITDIKSGVSFGAEFLYPVGSSIRIPLHFEYITKSVALEVTSSSSSYNLSIGSMPILTGIEYPLIKNNPKFDLSVAALVGLGLSTKFDIVNNKPKTASSAETLYKGSPLAVVGRVGADYRLNPKFSLHADAGYRMLKTSKISPSPVEASQTIVADSAGKVIQYAVDMSGVFFNLGAAYWF